MRTRRPQPAMLQVDDAARGLSFPRPYPNPSHIVKRRWSGEWCRNARVVRVGSSPRRSRPPRAPPGRSLHLATDACAGRARAAVRGVRHVAPSCDARLDSMLHSLVVRSFSAGVRLLAASARHTSISWMALRMVWDSSVRSCVPRTCPRHQSPSHRAAS